MSSASMIRERFRTLIAQPATLCNLDCGYCYLPDRKQQTVMSAKVAQRLAASIEEQDSVHPVELVWHGGEPLTTPLSHMRSLLAPFEHLRRDGRMGHGVQTNATLINKRWIEMFIEFGFRVGVSIDGPRELNATRLDRAGHCSYEKAMVGIGQLRDAEIPFSVICVVTARTIDRANELMDFFGRLECASVGFNIEEQEGLNAHREQVTPDQAYAFWSRLWDLRDQYPHLRVRDLDRLRGWLEHVRSGRNDPAHGYDPIPTVSATGQTVVLSPELLGIHAPAYSDFVIGNVLTVSLPRMLENLGRIGYVAEFDSGLRSCAAECEFWKFCRGAQAGNRFFEHGHFKATETAYCRNTYQAVVRSALDRTRGGRTR
jgi:uncharacterized protein